MSNQIEQLKTELQQTVNERNAAWAQLEAAGVPILSVEKNEAINERNEELSDITFRQSLLLLVFSIFPWVMGTVLLFDVKSTPEMALAFISQAQWNIDYVGFSLAFFGILSSVVVFFGCKNVYYSFLSIMSRRRAL